MQVVLLGGALAYVVVFLVTALLRLGYPYPLEPTEPASLAEVGRILSGQPLYVPPTLDYVPVVYGPIYFYVCALVAELIGPTFTALRLVSLLASIGSILVVFGLVQRETGSRLAAAVAAGLLAGSNAFAETAMDIGRVDALFTFFVLSAVLAARIGSLRTGRSRWLTLGGSGVLMGLAVFTKLPTAAAPIALGILVGVTLCLGKKVVAVAAGLCVSAGLILGQLRLQSGTWATWYLWDLPGQHAIARELVGRFWFVDVLPRFFVSLLLGPVFLLGLAARGDRSALFFYTPAFLSIVGVAWASRSGGGGAQNVLLPAFAVLAILLGLGLHEGLRGFAGTSGQTSTFRGYLVAVCLIQFALLVYDPRVTVPYRLDRVADEELAAAVSALPGPVFAPAFGGYTTSAQGQQPLMGAVDELTGGFGGSMTAEGIRWRADLDRALKQHYFRYVLLETRDCCLKDTVVAAGYVEKGALIRQEDNFYSWKAARTPEAQLYAAPEV
jgi:4-amino-4-deoxy-L-arabinose transferase-like glycosyltransferase